MPNSTFLYTNNQNIRPPWLQAKFPPNFFIHGSTDAEHHGLLRCRRRHHHRGFTVLRQPPITAIAATVTPTDVFPATSALHSSSLNADSATHILSKPYGVPTPAYIFAVEAFFAHKALAAAAAASAHSIHFRSTLSARGNCHWRAKAPEQPFSAASTVLLFLPWAALWRSRSRYSQHAGVKLDSQFRTGASHWLLDPSRVRICEYWLMDGKRSTRSSKNDKFI
ncbi:hypothetical protein CRG98_030250 [Punica granatum]|uniref:Uncharacterized protein n=1 Tax=Punica granatum TaxID=22663 RepID=A0A2I0IZ96_PUNGR|nr:hypothetical protein CRG98_030250 [Punica granatum]